VGGMVMFGSIAALDLVWNLADFAMAIMTIINLAAIVLLGKVALKALQDYQRQRRISKKNIVFHIITFYFLQII
jgi:AGCS family alanine or glycine:cation symporter